MSLSLELQIPEVAYKKSFAIQKFKMSSPSASLSICRYAVLFILIK